MKATRGIFNLHESVLELRGEVLVGEADACMGGRKAKDSAGRICEVRAQGKQKGSESGGSKRGRTGRTRDMILYNVPALFAAGRAKDN
jgi:hypothetical protein